MINTAKRIAELDFIRGLCIFLMILDHIAFIVLKFDLYYWGDIQSNFLRNFIVFCRDVYIGSFSQTRQIIRYCVLASFLLICGICCTFSKNNLKRVLTLSYVAISITLVMYILSSLTKLDLNIYFGVFHCYASCLIIYLLIKNLKPSIYPVLITIAAIISCLIIFFKPTLNTNILLAFGIPAHNYSYSIEYSPIFPAITIFLLGIYIGKTVYTHKKSFFPFIEKEKFFTTLGKHGIAVYLIHIPVVTLIVWLMGIIWK